MMNKFYGVGVGPGDPELITLKALKVLKEADIIFAPKSKTKADSLAREIVEKVLGEERGKDILEIEFPMINNKEELRKRYLKSAEIILQKIHEGKHAAYLTIGDPLLYSTYIYLLNALKEIAPGLQIETIPGVSAYSALAAKFSYSLAEKDEKICICPVPKDIGDLREIITKNDTVVIMKVAKRLQGVIKLLHEMNLLQYSVFGSRVGLKGERLINGMKMPFVVSEKEGYLSTIIVRNKK